MRKSVETIWNRDKSAFNVMDILIAVRSEGKKKVIDNLGRCVVLDSLFTSVDGVMEFLEDTGLAEIFRCISCDNFSPWQCSSKLALLIWLNEIVQEK